MKSNQIHCFNPLAWCNIFICGYTYIYNSWVESSFSYSFKILYKKWQFIDSIYFLLWMHVIRLFSYVCGIISHASNSTSRAPLILKWYVGIHYYLFYLKFYVHVNVMFHLSIYFILSCIIFSNKNANFNYLFVLLLVKYVPVLTDFVYAFSHWDTKDRISIF